LVEHKVLVEQVSRGEGSCGDGDFNRRIVDDVVKVTWSLYVFGRELLRQSARKAMHGLHRGPSLYLEALVVLLCYLHASLVA
jgi:hypothetical protein